MTRTTVRWVRFLRCNLAPPPFLSPRPTPNDDAQIYSSVTNLIQPSLTLAIKTPQRVSRRLVPSHKIFKLTRQPFCPHFTTTLPTPNVGKYNSVHLSYHALTSTLGSTDTFLPSTVEISYSTVPCPTPNDARKPQTKLKPRVLLPTYANRRSRRLRRVVASGFRYRLPHPPSPNTDASSHLGRETRPVHSSSPLDSPASSVGLVSRFA